MATIYYLNGPVGSDATDFFERTVEPALAETRAPVAGSLVTEPSPNDYTAQAVITTPKPAKLIIGGRP